MSFNLIANCAIETGFQMVGVSSAIRPATFEAFARWVDSGMFAGMSYLAKGLKARENPNSVLEGVRSIIMLGVSFERVLSCNLSAVSKIKGIADYARGVDYHCWIRERFKPVLSLHNELYPKERCRGVVDTAPLLERQYAVNAGLGMIGKNTMLITKQFGSNVFLAAILSTAVLYPAQPIFESNIEIVSTETKDDNFCNEKGKLNDPCGSCKCCMDVCPTQALVEPYMLDARLCLNYWTIEHQGKIPEMIRQKLGNRFFGCDSCRKVCPYNSPIPQPVPEIDPNSLEDNELRKIAKGTPLERKFR
ncbi:MAG: DUF1730 domain-containing protein [Planctomycetaceae bacterium]|jgi:epoxyqueuosine reductase|nr:DUF1730 domain-containing protein [Planctomycetaceae bacterium]